MTTEQMALIVGLMISFGLGLREVFKYWWKKTTKYIDTIELQLEELLGTPARDGNPAVEGKVPKLERELGVLKTDRDNLAEQLAEERTEAEEARLRRKQERDQERAEHKAEIRELNKKHEDAIKALVTQHRTDIRKAVADAIAPLKRQHAEELRVANENADKWQKAAKDSQRVAEESQAKIQTLEETVKRMQGEIDALKKRDTGKLDESKVPVSPPNEPPAPA